MLPKIGRRRCFCKDLANLESSRTVTLELSIPVVGHHDRSRRFPSYWRCERRDTPSHPPSAFNVVFARIGSDELAVRDERDRSHKSYNAISICLGSPILAGDSTSGTSAVLGRRMDYRRHPTTCVWEAGATPTFIREHDGVHVMGDDSTPGNGNTEPGSTGEPGGRSLVAHLAIRTVGLGVVLLVGYFTLQLPYVRTVPS